MPEPFRLGVGEVRQRIFEASGTPSAGSGSLAGRLFHRTVEAVFCEDHPAYWRLSLAADLDSEKWAARLYDLVLGPQLTRFEASLRESGSETLALWEGVRSFARWFCGLLRETNVQYDDHRERWQGADALFRTEVELAATFQEPEWPNAVEVTGRADHLIRLAPDRWCVVEFKLGAGHRESDLAQVCLYHEMLGGTGSAALVHFDAGPVPEQQVFNGDLIREVRPALVNLIGAMAGFSAAPISQPQTGWPKPARAIDIEVGERLIRALREYGADAKLAAEPLVGPTFVRYVLEPGRGISVSKLEQQGANLQMRLQLESPPLIGRSSGRIAVDIQRADREFVAFRDLLPIRERDRDSNSQVLAGIDLYGKVHFADLAGHAPHILVGGATFSGKSEWLRCAVASLLVSNSPDRLRLILIDPKKNAFSGLNQSEYLWRPDAFIDNPEEEPVLSMLEELAAEMRSRYDLLKTAHADNLNDYAQKTGSAPPRLVCVADEFAELLMSKNKRAAREIESGFVRIAQLGRAAGIHLILATQRPSKQIVTGLLKANMPAKIALRVANRVESSVLLDQTGAQFLLGNGDLLFSTGGYDPVRLQSAWIGEPDRQVLFAGGTRRSSSAS